ACLKSGVLANVAESTPPNWENPALFAIILAPRYSISSAKVGSTCGGSHVWLPHHPKWSGSLVWPPSTPAYLSINGVCPRQMPCSHSLDAISSGRKRLGAFIDARWISVKRL